MADPRELGGVERDYYPHDESSKRLPNCSGCLRPALILADLELPKSDPDKRYDINRDLADLLKRIAEVSPDYDAFTNEIMRQGLCPLSMLTTMRPEEVLARVDLGECVVLDQQYRPGIQAGDI